MPLLNKGNSKTVKGEKLGYRTYGLHLAPYNLSGRNICPHASKGCAESCLNTAGRGAMQNVQNARIAKTQRFFTNRKEFLSDLKKEITSSIKSARKAGYIPALRLNLTSDLPWHKIGNDKEKSILEEFPELQSYDYTKDYRRMIDFLKGKLPDNYDLTFSYSEDTTSEQLKTILGKGGKVAAVFRGPELPKTYLGFKVVDGDESDLRFLDPKGVIVGLVAKGKAKHDKSGFVIDPED